MVNTRNAFIFMIFIALIYMVLIVVYPQKGFWVVDNGAKLIYARSLIANDYQHVNLVYPGQALDPEFYNVPLSVRFSALNDGKLYSVYPLFFPLISSFMLQGLGYGGLYIIPCLSAVLLLWLTFLLAKHLQIDRAEWVIPLVGLATPVFFYALTFWEHAPAAMLVVLSFFILIRSWETPPISQMIIAGFSLAVATWMRQELYALVTAMVISYLLFNRHRKGIIFFLVAFAIGVIPLVWYNLQVSGSVLGFHITKNWELSEVAKPESGMVAILAEKWRIFHGLLFQTVKDRTLSAILMIPYAAFLLVAFLPAFRKKDKILLGTFISALIISLIGLIAKFMDDNPVYGSLYSCNFMVGTPLVIVGFLVKNLIEPEDDRPWINFILLTFGLFVIQFSLVSPLSGAMQWGSRFLLMFYPLCAILALYVWQHIRVAHLSLKPVWIGVLLVALAFSVTNQLRGVYLLYHKKKASERFIEVSQQQPGKTIMTDVWWYPLELGPIYLEKWLFYPRKGDGLNDATLVKLMLDLKEQGEDRFTFVTFTPQYPKYQPFFNSLPLGIASKKTYKPAYCDFMDLIFVQFIIKPVREDNKERYAVIYQQLAEYLIGQKMWDDARKALETSLEIMPHARTHYTLAAVHRVENRFELAEYHLAEAVRMNPKQKEYVRALEDIREEIRLRNRQP
ncbi:MAG: tetratricopeptide repeat protein [Gemmatimonadetes bacterium]|nr:MAG: tetratricopeptide repeat protein [Gemmatimonadota bacterium]